MTINIIKPNLDIFTEEGIPKCFSDIKEYFNLSLDKNAYPYLPRRNPITTKEIKNLWLPSLNSNITFHAELDGKVIGSATCFFDVSSSAYDKAKQRKPGEIGMTIHPDKNYRLVGSCLLKEMVKELKNQNKKAFYHTDADWKEEILMMKDLGYKGKLIENYERYQKAGLSGKVFEYRLP